MFTKFWFSVRGTIIILMILSACSSQQTPTSTPEVSIVVASTSSPQPAVPVATAFPTATPLSKSTVVAETPTSAPTPTPGPYGGPTLKDLKDNCAEESQGIAVSQPSPGASLFAVCFGLGYSLDFAIPENAKIVFAMDYTLDRNTAANNVANTTIGDWSNPVIYMLGKFVYEEGKTYEVQYQCDDQGTISFVNERGEPFDNPEPFYCDYWLRTLLFSPSENGNGYVEMNIQDTLDQEGDVTLGRIAMIETVIEPLNP